MSVCVCVHLGLTYAGDGHVHEVGSMVVVVPRPVILQSLEEAREHLLRDLTPSSFQIRESREAEIGVEVVGHRVEGPADGEGVGRAAELQLCRGGQRVLRHLRLFYVNLHVLRSAVLWRPSERLPWSRVGVAPTAAQPASKWRLPGHHIPRLPDDALPNPTF